MADSAPSIRRQPIESATHRLPTMIERVARAIHAEHNDDASAARQAADPGWDGWKSWIPVVRVAISEMRNGTRRMYESGAGEQGSRSAAEWDTAKSSAANAYLRTINAALAEDPTGA